jgi:integrase
MRYPRDMGKPKVESFLTMLAEGLSLRVKDVDFDRKVIVVRSGKGDKDRVVMLPISLVPVLKAQLAKSCSLWAADRASGHSGVFMPHALEAKYPRSGQSCAWHWVFPSPTLSVDPRSGVERRHHLFEERLGRKLNMAVERAAIGHRHTYGTRAVGSWGRQHHHGLHPCVEGGSGRGQKPNRCINWTV